MSFPPSIRNPCKLNSKKRLDIDVIVSSGGSISAAV
jgi:hypothetical protein